MIAATVATLFTVALLIIAAVMNPGNHSEGPGGGKEAPCYVTVGGKHGGCIETRGRVPKDG